MEPDWSTFVLEILNFMILVWILQHFLYRPVLAVIARRQAATEQVMADAESRRTQAGELEKRFEGRLAAWEREKQQAREALETELAGVRQRRLAEIETEIGKAAERARISDERRAAAVLQAQEHEALELAGRFAARLLQRVASPALEAQLVNAALADLDTLDEARRSAFREGLNSADSIQVNSAYALGREMEQTVRRHLEGLAQRSLTCDFRQDPSVVAGLRVVAGPWSLRASLRDELDGFIGMARDGRNT